MRKLCVGCVFLCGKSGILRLRISEKRRMWRVFFPMEVVAVVLVGFALSMDAFAVAVSNGICVRNVRLKDALKVGAAFGFFQGLMPIIGWAIGSGLNNVISKYNHWVAFVLLVFIGGKMIVDAVKGPAQGLQGDSCPSDNREMLGLKVLTVMAIATSLDALAAGISLAMTNVNIYYAAAIIAVITFVMSFIGVCIGKRCESFLGNKAEMVGGIILIIIGVKILLDGLGVL